MKERLHQIIYAQGINITNNLQVMDNRIVMFEECFDGSRICIDYNISTTEFKLSIKGENEKDWENIDISTSLQERVVDLDNTGRRVEGTMINGSLFGFVKYFDSDNNMEFRGFVYRNKKYGYGVSYFPDGAIDTIAYYYRDKKFGPAQIYDKRGNCKNLSYINDNANYVKDLVISDKEDWEQIHTLIEKITIERIGTLNKLVLIGYSQLREFSMSTEDSKDLRVIQINNCHNLLTVSFIHQGYSWNCCELDRLELSVCDKLSMLSIDNNSLGGTKQFKAVGMKHAWILSRSSCPRNSRDW